MKVALAQLNPRIGDFTANVARLLDRIAKARSAGVDLLLFPELAVSGYPPRDFLDFASFLEAGDRALERVTAATQGITVVCGFVDRNAAPVGRPLFNAAAVLQNGRRIAVYHKQLLPYYDVFDEPRYFEPGANECLFTVAGKRIAVSICEDAWNFSSFTKRPYARTPVQSLKGKGADCLVNLSASPFFLGRPQERLALFRTVATTLQIPVLVANQVGGNDELLFDGCSFVLSAAGEPVAIARAFEEDLLALDFEAIDRLESASPAWPQSEAEWLFLALSRGLKDYVEKCGASQVVLGLSGGIDSAVVAAIAAHALGKEKVSAISLPSRYTSSPSVEDAERLARTLGIAFRNLTIQPLLERYLELWQNWYSSPPDSLTQENLQPRIRMTVLMAIANQEGRFLLNTSNKSEIATGYATLYGDSAGALAVLGDLTKHQVYDLARFINHDGEVIPKRILERPPTAELKENQTDQDTLPPYDVLDAMVKVHVEEQRGPAELSKAGFPDRWVKLYERIHPASEYKRKQLPPVIRVSPRAFGMGRRMPIAAKNPE